MITDRFVLPFGCARYAGISVPSAALKPTGPASRPSLSVMMVCADTGITQAAKPLPTAALINVRRLNGTCGTRLSISGVSMQSSSGMGREGPLAHGASEPDVRYG